MKPLVSVITPSYNQGKFIRATIESVLNQDYENVEYIVVDGGSTDETLSILKEYETRLKYISEPDHGQSDAINKGFRMAKGSIVAWLNSDDVYEPGCISHAVELMQAHPQAALLYGEGYIIDEAGTKVKAFEYTRDFSLWALIYIWDYIMQPTTFFRADALKAVGYLNESLNWAIDWDLWIKLALRYDVLYTERFMACSREYRDTKTSTGSQKRLDEILGLMRRYTGEHTPYGYEIYYCAELLTHPELMTKERLHEVKSTLELRLNRQPVPDKLGRALGEANFMFRPHDGYKQLVVDVQKHCEVLLSITLNGRLIANRIFSAGRTVVPIILHSSENTSFVHINIQGANMEQMEYTHQSYLKLHMESIPPQTSVKHQIASVPTWNRVKHWIKNCFAKQ